ncbi:CHAT domain-containing protein [Streptomyces sp. NPDC051963]|uniref:CHAT domain-containing protein n=1 Tax=Streptomyces sp. NPDC051963 TaxID=3365678 RepID=UPI0037D8B815
MTTAQAEISRRAAASVLHIRAEHGTKTRPSEILATLSGPNWVMEGGTTYPAGASEQQREDLRWYFEDYLEYPTPAGDSVARSATESLQRLGERWFSQIFLTEGMRQVWAEAEPCLSTLRIEIQDDTPEGDAIMWEALCPPGETALAVRASSFVRAIPGEGEAEHAPGAAAEAADAARPIRVLVVISRPFGSYDVPYRAVALRLLEGGGPGPGLTVEVLRPATYERLCVRLAEAKDAGSPFDIVHFDGHGQYEEDDTQHPAANSSKPRGYIVFEDPHGLPEGQLMFGAVLGKVLVSAGVRVLGLNACRSAHSDASSSPTAPGLPTAAPNRGPEAYPSFAMEAFRAGVPSVLAMRYSIYVPTAGDAVAAVYKQLAGGASLGEAVTGARRALADQPLRQVSGHTRPLADWVVPVAYERSTPLVRTPSGGCPPGSKELSPDLVSLDTTIPPPPATGLVGQDQTMLSLDRSFDEHRIVCLHGMAGAGKSAVAAEFARWYRLTASSPGLVLWTSFRQPRTPEYLAEQYEAALRTGGTLASGELLLWVWDNVQALSGSAEAERLREYGAFAADLAGRGVRVLLTSRRDETSWLTAAHQIPLQGMHLQDSAALINALLSERIAPSENSPDDWSDLLKASRGNPLLLCALTEHIASHGLWSSDARASLLRQAATTVASPQRDAAGAELTPLREIIRQDVPITDYCSSVLGLAQGFISLRVLGMVDLGMTHLGEPPAQPINWKRLLLDLCNIGVAQHVDSEAFLLHPLLPEVLPTPQGRTRVAEGFIFAFSGLGALHHMENSKGSQTAVTSASQEEDNYLAAFRMCVQTDGWHLLQGIMSGLRVIYESSGRQETWNAVIDEAASHAMDPQTDGPLPGREILWSYVSEFIVQRSIRNKRWGRARGLQEARIEHDIRTLQTLERDPVDWAALPQAKTLAEWMGGVDQPGFLQSMQEEVTRGLAVSYVDLGNILKGLESPECFDTYLSALRLFEELGDTHSIASTNQLLGAAAMHVPGLVDLDAAEEYTCRSLQVRVDAGYRGSPLVYGQLGNIYHRRAIDRMQAHQNADDLLQKALGYHERALSSLPDCDSRNRGPAYNNLGSLLLTMGNLEEGRRHLVRAIEAYATIGALDDAAYCSLTLATVLLQFRRFDEAHEHADSALQHYRETNDATGLAHAEEVLRVLRQIE